MRTIKKISIKNDPDFKSNLLAWAQQFEQIVWLDSNNYPQKYSKFQAVLAVDAHSILQSDFKNAFTKLKNYKNDLRDYIFGYFSYDLKNDIEDLRSDNFDGLQFPELYFFQPKKLFFLNDNDVEVQYLKDLETDIEKDISSILNMDTLSKKLVNSIEDYSIKHEVKIHKRITKKAYLNNLQVIQEHIHRGDIYEVNYCQEFYAENTQINPLEVYLHLNDISKPPFASFVKLNDLFLLSASPERFVTKEKNKIISQPIKGTAKRSTNKSTDKELAKALSIDKKERAENIMIVDLVRNDLSKTAIRGTVTVEELCKVYSFDQVHQMISTITSMIDDETETVDVIKSLFPMGSMTGAPKISAMKIIEKLETTKRSLYSGAVGYFTPSDDFDFNVVIRSILYNRTEKYLSYSVGGAITSESDPEKEYQECLLKAIAMKKALKN
ncbi:MAG: anthranilate synthase component I family protein [Flavobacteriaceae bacterium]|nr:anthranilate synthase component I family protein [Flavobacteriaceae bacterium]